MFVFPAFSPLSILRCSFGILFFLGFFACEMQEGNLTVGTIKGKITDQDTGVEISGVTVSLGSKSSITSTDGSYLLIGVAVGSAQGVTYSKTGYTSQTVSITIARGSTSTTKDVQLMTNSNDRTAPATWNLNTPFDYAEVLDYLRSERLTIVFGDKQYAGVIFEELAHIKLERAKLYASPSNDVLVMLFGDHVYIKIYDLGTVYDAYIMQNRNTYQEVLAHADAAFASILLQSTANLSIVLSSSMFLTNQQKIDLEIKAGDLSETTCSCVAMSSAKSATATTDLWTLRLHRFPRNLNIDIEVSTLILTLLNVNRDIKMQISFFDGTSIPQSDIAGEMFTNFELAVSNDLDARSIHIYIRNAIYEKSIAGKAYVVNQVGAVQRLGISSKSSPTTLAHEVGHTLGAVHNDKLYQDKNHVNLADRWFRSCMASSSGLFSPRNRAYHGEINKDIVRKNLK